MSEIGRFTDDILTAARKKAHSIVGEAEDETQKALDEARAEFSRQAQGVVRDALTAADAVKRRQMSEVRHRMKLREQIEKNRVLTDVLEEAKKRMAEFVDDERRYLPYLVGLITIGVRELGSEEVTVNLGAKDLARIDKRRLEHEIGKKLGKAVKIAWSKDALDIIGGAVVSISDGKIRIVNTIDQLLEAVEPKLLIEAGGLLFEGKVEPQ